MEKDPQNKIRLIVHHKVDLSSSSIMGSYTLELGFVIILLIICISAGF